MRYRISPVVFHVDDIGPGKTYPICKWMLEEEIPILGIGKKWCLITNRCESIQHAEEIINHLTTPEKIIGDK